MILWLILIAPIAVFIYLSIKEDFIEGVAALILGGIVALILFCVIYCAVESMADIDYKKIETCEISALADNAQYSQTVSGSVFLIQSRVDSTLKYNYMYYKDNRGYAFNEVEANCCYINYDDGVPRLEVYEPFYTSKFVAALFVRPIFTDCDYVFYLPQDAKIIDSFIIDFE